MNRADGLVAELREEAADNGVIRLTLAGLPVGATKRNQVALVGPVAVGCALGILVGSTFWDPGLVVLTCGAVLGAWPARAIAAAVMRKRRYGLGEDVLGLVITDRRALIVAATGLTEPVTLFDLPASSLTWAKVTDASTRLLRSEVTAVALGGPHGTFAQIELLKVSTAEVERLIIDAGLDLVG